MAQGSVQITFKPRDAWPAPEAVALYFGRAAEENCFSQEDREIGLDRIRGASSRKQRQLGPAIAVFSSNTLTGKRRHRPARWWRPVVGSAEGGETPLREDPLVGQEP